MVASASVAAACGSDNGAEPLLPAPEIPENAQKFRELSPGEYGDYMGGRGR